MSDVQALIEEMGLAQINDHGEISALVENVLAAHADAVENYRKGKEGALNFLLGQVMSKSKQRANVQAARTLILERIGGN